MRDEAGKVYGGQVMWRLFSWLRHLDIIPKAEWNHRRNFGKGNDVLRYMYLNDP